MSLLALFANVALAVYQFRKIYLNKHNPLKDEIYTETAAYKNVIADLS